MHIFKISNHKYEMHTQAVTQQQVEEKKIKELKKLQLLVAVGLKLFRVSACNHNVYVYSGVGTALLRCSLLALCRR